MLWDSALLLLGVNDRGDDPVLLGLRWAHVEVAIDVFGDLIFVLARGFNQDVHHDILGVADLPSLDLDVSCLTAGSTQRLVDHDASVGQRVATTLLSSAQ